MAAKLITRLNVQVEAIKRIGPSSYEVRAFVLPQPHLPITRPPGGSVFFDMEDPEKAPTIFQRLVVTIEESIDISE